MRKVLTIAGSDSGGGAGIAADLKTFQAFGVYGAIAITAVTAQNTKTVTGIFPLPASFVALQIDTVMEEERVTVWKTGMLATSNVVETIAKKAKKHKIKKLIVDPVMIATSGRRLLAKNAIDTLKKLLLPLAYIVTPNILEAEVLTQRKISSIDDMKEAAVLLHTMGARYVVVKGGHFYGNQESGIRNQGEKNHYSSFIIPNSRSDVVDILYDGKKFHEFSSPRAKRKVHGTGCTFASAIAAELAKGSTIVEAVRVAKGYVRKILLAA